MLARLLRPNLLQRVRYRLKFALAQRALRRSGLTFGPGTTINPHATFMDPELVTIGRDCSISGAMFVTHNGFDRVVRERTGVPVNSKRPIVIGDRCAVGVHAVILYGVTIGDDCVIGAGAVVRKSVPPNSVVIGNPAQIVGTTDELVDRMTRRADRRKQPEARDERR